VSKRGVVSGWYVRACVWAGPTVSEGGAGATCRSGSEEASKQTERCRGTRLAQYLRRGEGKSGEGRVLESRIRVVVALIALHRLKRPAAATVDGEPRPSAPRPAMAC
jgi:hypothetical protein